MRLIPNVGFYVILSDIEIIDGSSVWFGSFRGFRVRIALFRKAFANAGTKIQRISAKFKTSFTQHKIKKYSDFTSLTLRRYF